MSIWIEIHCDVPMSDVDSYMAPTDYIEGGCYTLFRGIHPSGKVSKASKVPGVLRFLGSEAIKHGWKKNRYGWACPACTKAGFSAREETP